MKNNKHTALFCISLLLLASCTSKPAAKEENVATTIAINGTNCYGYASDKDTVLMKLTLDNPKAHGTLLYKYYEKDMNTGTIDGRLRGDTLFLTYSFLSEGIESKRDVVFLKNDAGFQEGYGALVADQEILHIANKSTIDFSKGVQLVLIDCK